MGLLLPDVKTLCFLLDASEDGNPRRLDRLCDAVADAYHTAVTPLGSVESVRAHRLDVGRFRNEAWSLLDQVEMDVADRFYHASDRQRYIFAHAVLRLLLSMRCGVNPYEIRFRKGKYGKPVLAFPECTVCFNMSYGNDLLAFALAEVPVGIDVEKLRCDFDFEAIGRSFFTTEECVFLTESSTEIEKMERFFFLWCRKEALVKAAGLSIDAMLRSNALNPMASLQDDSGISADFVIQTLPQVLGHAFALAIKPAAA